MRKPAAAAFAVRAPTGRTQAGLGRRRPFLRRPDVTVSMGLDLDASHTHRAKRFSSLFATVARRGPPVTSNLFPTDERSTANRYHHPPPACQINARPPCWTIAEIVSLEECASTPRRGSAARPCLTTCLVSQSLPPRRRASSTTATARHIHSENPPPHPFADGAMRISFVANHRALSYRLPLDVVPPRAA